MIHEELTDYRSYIQSRIREIDDLDERKYAKKILLEGLGEIFRLTEERYLKLSERIQNEIDIPFDKYAVVTTVINKEDYDPINGTLFPVCSEDTEKNSMDNSVVIFLEADDSVCQAFLKKKQINGCVEGSGENISFEIRKCERYLKAVEKLYQLYKYNEIPWDIIHMGYMERFFEMVPVSGLKEKEGISDKNIAFEWGEYSQYVRTDRIPLWNINRFNYQSQDFTVPCIDGMYYEHVIQLNDSQTDRNGYLVGIQKDIESIRYEKNKIILKTKQEMLQETILYGIYNKDIMYSPGYGYKGLSNRRKYSFAGRYTYKTGKFIQTEMELIRKIEELSNNYKLKVVKYELTNILSVPEFEADMNQFIETEIFSNEKRTRLLIHFERPAVEDFLYQSQIRYVLSQLQMEYLEYKCVGTFA